jgi:hypothetical protein
MIPSRLPGQEIRAWRIFVPWPAWLTGFAARHWPDLLDKVKLPFSQIQFPHSIKVTIYVIALPYRVFVPR